MLLLLQMCAQYLLIVIYSNVWTADNLFLSIFSLKCRLTVTHTNLKQPCSSIYSYIDLHVLSGTPEYFSCISLDLFNVVLCVDHRCHGYSHPGLRGPLVTYTSCRSLPPTSPSCLRLPDSTGKSHDTSTHCG